MPGAFGREIDQDVGRFDVAVDETGLVGCVERIGHVDHDFNLLAEVDEVPDFFY